MNDYLLSVLLGVVEGLTEFLPVSSTAHLRISEALLHLSLDDAYWKMYTIVIQLGAILALMLLYWGRIMGFVSSFPRGRLGDRNWLNHPISLTMVAFVCTAVPALLFTKLIGKALESLPLMATSLVVGGIIMWGVDYWSSRRDATTKDVEDMALGQAVFVGICQVFSAVFPGTSRSMSTIAAGQMVGLSRPAALEFSFLVCIPTMVAATCYDLLKTLHPHKVAGADPIAPLVMTGHNWVVLGIGFAVSFLVALGVVKWFLHWVREHGFAIFALYRIVVGLALLVWMLAA